MENTPENIELIQRFLKYVVKELGIESNAKIVLLFEHDPNYPSAGGYLPSEKKVICAVKNRAIADVMRTLAHELTHHRQNELKMIGPEDGDNQKLEDQANVFAGRLVRWFGRENREIYADLG
jgi:Zn-dependent peptidase ImmA (M78 family)